MTVKNFSTSKVEKLGVVMNGKVALAIKKEKWLSAEEINEMLQKDKMKVEDTDESYFENLCEEQQAELLIIGDYVKNLKDEGLFIPQPSELIKEIMAGWFIEYKDSEMIIEISNIMTQLNIPK